MDVGICNKQKPIVVDGELEPSTLGTRRRAHSGAVDLARAPLTKHRARAKVEDARLEQALDSHARRRATRREADPDEACTKPCRRPAGAHTQ